MSCPPDRNGKLPKRTISLYFLSETSDPTRVDDPGAVCFEVHDFNDILYDPSFAVTETVPAGSAFADLQAAITAVTGFSLGSTGGGAKAAAAQPQCSAGLMTAVTTAQGTAARFGAALAAIDPGKDSSGNVNLVDWRTTKSRWQLGVPETYQQFEASVSRVIEGLKSPGATVDCPTGTKPEDVLAAAEAIVIETYVPARVKYSTLASHVASEHIVRFTSDVHPTSSYALVVTATSKDPVGSVANGRKTFSLAAGRKILSTSGGFLITEVPSTSYSSVTAPSGTTTPATQNVLAVSNPNGPSVGLTALVNVYLPSLYSSDGSKVLPLNGHNWGLAVSVGPTYNLTNGKADTSKVGLFAGMSLHIRNQFFLTPGANLGQYSDWPIGFTHAGQVIPANSGTPTGTSRWTTRFAFALTYKIKDFGQSASAIPATPAPTTNAPPAKTP
jgi:hypothetical protein